MDFEITIPVLNEEEALEPNVAILRDFLEKHFASRDWQIAIADNGSTDRTPQIGRKMEEKQERLRYIRLEWKGVGLALKSSWGSSNADVVGYMDLDLATDLKHFPEALAAIEEKNYDLVYGSRLHKDSKVEGRTRQREIISRSFNQILRSYLNIQFSDGMCGFKFLRRTVYPKLLAHGAQSDGWFFSTELLVAAEWLGYKVYELPVHWTDDPDSRVKVRKLTMEYLKGMRELKKQEKTIRKVRV